nr:GHKL domain-containing protein [uncultured Clostridium sp.]
MNLTAKELDELISSGVEELLWASLFLLVVSVCAKLTIKKSELFRCITAAVLLVIRICYFINIDSKGQVAFTVFLAVMFVSVLSVSSLIDMNKSDVMFLGVSFLVPYFYFNSSYTLLGYGSWYLYVLEVLLLFTWSKNGSLKGKMFGLYAAFAYLCLMFFVYYPIADYLFYSLIYKGTTGNICLLAGWSLIISVLAGITILLVHKWRKQLETLKNVSHRYEVVEKIIIGFAVMMIVFVISGPVPILSVDLSNDMISLWLSGFYIIMLLFQISFLVLIYHLTYSRQTIEFMEESKRRESGYYKTLNQNLKEMANLRHDIRNLFLTMGNFVDRGNDKEMKAFYKENIYPFALDQIEKNYQFAQLCKIPSESLQSFLHMKLYQAHSANLNIKVIIDINENEFRVGMELMDITRILGILIDNAIEECSMQEMPFLELGIRSQNNKVSYSLKNSVRDGRSFENMRLNKSDKKGHSGRGLKIVKELVDDYQGAELNTYFDNKIFLQILNIDR